MKVPIEQLKPNPFNPRIYYPEDSINELAANIKRYGLLQAIIVRKLGNHYEIAYGHRRVKAVEQLGWTEIPAQVKVFTDEEMLDISISENLQREDLSDVEVARAFTKYLEQGLSQTDIAERIGKSQGYIAQKLQLLTLPPEIQHAIITRVITERHARELLRFKRFLLKWLAPEDQIRKDNFANRDAVADYWVIGVFEYAQQKKLSVRALQDYLDNWRWNHYIHARRYEADYTSPSEKLESYDYLFRYGFAFPQEYTDQQRHEESQDILWVLQEEARRNPQQYQEPEEAE